MEKLGLVHLYCGEGKGKTTAAFGLALRCLGHGGRAVITQFLKDGDSGECRMLRDMEDVTIFAAHPCHKFSFQMNEDEKAQTAAVIEQLFDEMAAFVCRTQPDLLVLDEICAAVNAGFLKEERLLEFLDHRPKDLEIVLTGRGPSAALCERADYMSEIQCRKHPYQNGIAARKGVEF